jgi:oligoendopeptidase F
MKDSPVPAEVQFERSFVPREFDPADWGQVEPLYRELMGRPIGSVAGLARWLTDFSELSSVVEEYGARRYIDKSCHTDDEAIKARFLQFGEEIEPRIKPLFFELQKKLIGSPYVGELKDRKYSVLLRKWGAEVEVFREVNVPLETESIKRITEYDTICGAMTVNFRGQELTLEQASKYLEDPDRAARQEAWELIAERRYRDRASIEDIFDQLLGLRNAMARNAGLPDYRALVWKQYARFDYSPEQCLAFADAIERSCVPLVEELYRRRAKELGLERLRPWDTDVDPKGRAALAPFEAGRSDVLVEKTGRVFGRMSGALAEDFDSLRRRKNLDLDSRKGKQPGGYQSTLNEAREPFIFMNAAGLHADVVTLLHEGGHAFHSLAARGEDVMFLRHAPIEFCEVASMSMELLGADHYDLYYDDAADVARARRMQLERVIKILPWIATIDSFQHWLYTHPGHSREERTGQWLALHQRFGGRLDWGGYEHVRRTMWMRQLHLFHVPFYYVEYGIAQLGALQLWVKSRDDSHRALSNYRAGLRLGGTRGLPELFAAAGIVFDFSERTLGPLMEAVWEELEGLPE